MLDSLKNEAGNFGAGVKATMWNAIPFHDSPYFYTGLLMILGLIVLWILLWFYVNFWS